MWPRVAAQLTKSPRDFAYLIIYWSCVEAHPDGSWRLANDEEEQFRITPLMRHALRDVATELDFHEFVQPI